MVIWNAFISFSRPGQISISACKMDSLDDTPLETAIKWDRYEDRKRVFPVLLRAGAAIPPNVAHPCLRKVAAAGGFAAYERAHRLRLATILARVVFPRLPVEMVSRRRRVRRFTPGDYDIIVCVLVGCKRDKQRKIRTPAAAARRRRRRQRRPTCAHTPATAPASAPLDLGRATPSYACPALFASLGGQSHVLYPPSSIEMHDARGGDLRQRREPLVVRLAEPVV